MATLPVGIQVYTVRNEWAQDPVGTIRTLAEIGYAGLESGVPAGMSVQDFAALLDDLGLKYAGSHTSLEALETNPSAAVDLCGALGTQYVTISSIPPSQRNSAQAWRDSAKRMEAVGAKLAQQGVVLSYHNHAFEFETFDGEYGLDILYSTASAEALCAQLDTYWVKKGGADPVAYLRKMANRCPLLHIKDMDPSDGSFAEIGEGDLDWPNIFQAAEDGNVQWLLVEQDTWKRPPMDCARLSFENLKKMGRV